MATTQLAILSERIGQTVLSGQVTNITSAADWNESFTRPAGFGDCLIANVLFVVSSIQTIVAAGDMRGPTVLLITNVVKDFIAMQGWQRQAIAVLSAASGELTRPVLWRADEVLNMQALSEDAGAGNTSDIQCIVRVMRLRNQIPG